jgi:transcriptional regulator with XRE-family HTH domain
MPEGGPTLDNVQIPDRVVAGDFPGWLRDAMAARRMSARMVGLRTGINHSTITRLLYGYRQPNLATFIALLQLFDDRPARYGSPTNGDARAIRR